jgi:drug/metabolite transporter (DMT)-like permease
MDQRVKGFAAGILAAVFYGTNPLGTLPLYADGINSGSVLFYRYGISVVTFIIWLLLRGESLKIKWGHAIKLAILGAMFSMSSLTLYESFHYMNAGVASTILFSYPIMTALIMVMFYHERVNLAHHPGHPVSLSPASPCSIVAEATAAPPSPPQASSSFSSPPCSMPFTSFM